MKHTLMATMVLATLALNPATAEERADEVLVFMQGRAIVLDAPEPAAGYQLLVRDPRGAVTEHAFHGDDPLRVPGPGRHGAWIDGGYGFEIRAIDSARVRGVHDAQETGVQDGPRVWSGSFAVRDGSLVDPTAEEVPATELHGTARPASRAGGVMPADQVIPDDLIVQGSACVGIDCVDNEAFSFDTLRLKENNIQIHFDDTSTAAGFPANDWRIVANDSANGGRNYLAIEDATAGRRPFYVMAGAPENALYVGANGLSGFGTSTPVMALSLLRGNTPGVRMEQAGGGFSPYTWDVAGNEANFFVRDATNGSQLPFRIFPGATTNALTVGQRGVGVGVQAPLARLHVRDTDSDPRGQQARFESALRTRLAFADSTGADTWHIDVGTGEGSAGSISFVKPGVRNSSNLARMRLDGAGNLRLLGTLAQNSDRDSKRAGESVDPGAILEGVLSLPISRWSFLADAPQVTHIGPMAQDFHAVFGLGDSERSIAPLDTSGVALAAIQALAAQIGTRDARIAELEEDVARLAQAVEALSRGAR